MMNDMTIHEKSRGKAKKAVILARVSSREQEEGLSIEAQKHRLRQYCTRHGLEALRIFEITESTTNGDREKFMDMIRFTRSQRETIAIVADKIDRVQRSFKEYPLLDGLIQEGKIELHFNTENYVIHKDSMSQERLMWSFGVIMAQSYVDNLRDNVKRSIDHKIRLGEYTSMAPIGYLNVRDNHGKSDIVPDPDRAPLVARLFEEYATGLRTTKELTEMAKNWGLRSRKGNALAKSTIHKTLQNPFYYGIMKIKGEKHPHRYKPIIDLSLYQRCQDVLRGHNKKPFKWGGKDFIFRGLITCGVSGKTVSALEKKKKYKNGTEGCWVYWRCQSPEDSKKTLYIKEEEILSQVETAIQDLHISKDTLESVTEYMHKTSNEERDFLQRQIKERRREQDNLRFKSDKLMDLLMDGLIDRADFERRQAQFKERRAEIESQLLQQDRGNDSFNDAMLFLLDLSSSAIDLWKGSTNAEKRDLAGFLFENLTLKGSTLCYSFKKPFCWFSQCDEIENWWALIDKLRTTSDNRLLVMQQYSPDVFKRRS